MDNKGIYIVYYTMAIVERGGNCITYSNNQVLNYSAGKRDRGKRHPQEEGGEAPRLHRTGGEAPCSMKGRKTRREENVFKGVENLPALLYTIV